MKRPDGWKNPHEALLEKAMNLRPDNFDYASVRREIRIYEAGADAYEKAIWKLAKDSPTGTFTFDTHTINIFEEIE